MAKSRSKSHRKFQANLQTATLTSLLLDSLIQFLDLRLELHIHPLQLIPPISGMRRQRQRRDRVLARLRP
jgi:hypothetical protein